MVKKILITAFITALVLLAFGTLSAFASDTTASGTVVASGNSNTNANTTFSVTGVIEQPDPTNNTTSVVTAQQQEEPGINVDKEANPTTVEKGGKTTVTITLAGNGVRQNVDAVFLLDASDSMTGDAWDIATIGPVFILIFADWYPPNTDQIAIAHYSTAATIDQELTSDPALVFDALEYLYNNFPGGGDDMTAGITAAQTELESGRHNPNNLPIIVLFSDGFAGNEAAALAAANAAKTAGTRIITVGINPEQGIPTPFAINEGFLKQLASSEDDYYNVNDIQDEEDVIRTYLEVLFSLSRAGTDLVLTDVLSNSVTLVPNSFKYMFGISLSSIPILSESLAQNVLQEVKAQNGGGIIWWRQNTLPPGATQTIRGRTITWTIDSFSAFEIVQISYQLIVNRSGYVGVYPDSRLTYTDIYGNTIIKVLPKVYVKVRTELPYTGGNGKAYTMFGLLLAFIGLALIFKKQATYS